MLRQKFGREGVLIPLTAQTMLGNAKRLGGPFLEKGEAGERPIEVRFGQWGVRIAKGNDERSGESSVQRSGLTVKATLE